MLWSAVLYIPPQPPYLMASAGNSQCCFTLYQLDANVAPKVDLSALLRVFYAS